MARDNCIIAFAVAMASAPTCICSAGDNMHLFSWWQKASVQLVAKGSLEASDEALEVSHGALKALIEEA
jgi:hypothetical protein